MPNGRVIYCLIFSLAPEDKKKKKKKKTLITSHVGQMETDSVPAKSSIADERETSSLVTLFVLYPSQNDVRI